MKFEPSLLKSLGLHLALIGLLFLSVNFTAEPTPTPAANTPVIQATFIDAQAIADKKREEERKLAEQKRQQDLSREKQRKAQEAKRRKAEQAKAKKAAEEKRKREQKRQQELKKKAAEEARRKRELEAQRKRQAEEAKKQAELDKLLEEQLQAERNAQQARRNQQVLGEVERYTAQITARVQRHIIEDDAFVGKTCKVKIRLASTGLVTSVSSSGYQALCRVAENAVRREEQFEMSDDPQVYEKLKNITITVAL